MRESRPTVEYALLRLALVLEPTRRQREVAARLAGEIRDPTLLLDAAAAHGLALALRDLLRDVPTTPALQRALVDHAMGVAARTIVAEAQLSEVLHSLRAAGVQALVLKGPALARAYYEPVGRNYEDLDLLVRESDLDAAEQALRDAGYATLQPIPGPMEAEFRRRYSERVFRGPRPLDVDLHWRLSQHLWPLAWVPEQMFASHRLLRVGDVDVQVPCSEDLLLYLASHAAKDGYRRWIWIVDFARVLDRERGVDFNALGLRARRLGVLRALACALALAVPHLPTPPHTTAIALATWGPAVALAHHILATPPHRAGSYPPKWEGWDLATRLRDRPRERWLRPIAETILPTPNEWSLLAGVPLGRFLAPVLRPLRIAYRSLGVALRVRRAGRTASRTTPGPSPDG